MMTIGIDGRELQGRPTGVGRYLRNLIRAWSRTQEDRLIVYFNGAAPLEAVPGGPGVTPRLVGTRPARGLLWQERSLPQAARGDALSVFFAPAYACPLSLPVPRVTTVHDLSFFSQPQDFAPLDGLRRRALVGASLRVSRAVIAVSEFTRREILARFPETADRVFHVPEGTDDDLPQPPPREEARRRLRIEGPLVITVGSILNRRCLPALLRATAQLVKGWPRLILDVVGENRTQPPLDLPRAVSDLGLDEHVRLSGYVSDVDLADRYAAADVGVFLSLYEGFGLPGLEAMSRGLPVVASRFPALGEILAGAALFVDPNDVAAITNGVGRLLLDPALRADLILSGRQRAARYSWQAAAEQTREILRQAARA